MFEWCHEHSIEVDFPIQKVWDFYSRMSNWKVQDPFDSYHQEGPFQTGSVVKAKIKNRNAYVNLLLTEVKSPNEFKIFIKVPFSKQSSHCILQEISPEKTRITTRLVINSFFTPFLKSFYLRIAEKVYPEFFEHMLQKLPNMQ
jgi:hypothetical protein